MTHSTRRRTGAALAAGLLLSVAAALPASAADAGGPAPGAPTTFADLAARVAPSVVNISATQTLPGDAGAAGNFDDMLKQFFKDHGGGSPPPSFSRKSTSLGSGFIIDEKGIVVTNNHVIAKANDIEVIFADGHKLKATLVGTDPKVDVAVLKIVPDRPLKAVHFGDSDKLRVGDWVMAVGNPFGLGGTVTAGIVSARNRNIDDGPYDDFIQTDAPINKGNSGGPLFDLAGEVMGINTAILSPSGGSIGIGFATPATALTPVIAQLEKYGHTRRGWLGVRIQDVTPAIAESLGLKEAKGALVAALDPKGPAKPAGMEPGDVIVKFGGKDIATSHDLPIAVANTIVGAQTPVVVLRKGVETTLTVKIAELAEGPVKTAAASVPAAPPPAVDKALGMSFSSLTAELRTKFGLPAAAKGVVIVAVEPGSPAADKGLAPGDVVAEVNQIAVREPKDVATQVEAAKKAGRKSALLLVEGKSGDMQFVPVPVD